MKILISDLGAQGAISIQIVIALYETGMDNILESLRLIPGIGYAERLTENNFLVYPMPGADWEAVKQSVRQLLESV